MRRYLHVERAAAVGAALAALTMVLPAAGAGADPDPASPALITPFQLVEDRDVDDRLSQPEDRYALAGGCYTMQRPDGQWLSRDGNRVTLTDDADAATPLHLQATRLGRYLLATNEGPDTAYEDGWWDVRGYVTAPTDFVAGAIPGAAAIATEPSPQGDWEIVATGDDPDRKVEVEAGETQSYHVRLPESDGGYALGEFAFHHVADDDLTDDDPNGSGCANWPEISTDTVGEPAPNPDGPAAAVQGFFEAHVHGMAFEFLGGEVRCGRPWHPYGVEYALVDCEDHEPGGHGAVLEIVVSGGDPVAGHDTVGWPTFGYWPRHDSLTHEQFYYRWLERAHLGGLRLMTNLLVDNTALCQAYPHKRNSCNEMDGVRLQALRLFELQDYIDAQSGGPGEGWLRIVTSPTQARETINAGRLAVVLGIEVSVPFDCGEIFDVPQCTEAEIDQRLDEVYDMGVRQMELINKFDNALSGVTGDGGATGIVVNTGNRWVTGHWWDMQACEEDEGHVHHEHDKTQINFEDDFPDGGQDEIDVLAGAIIDQFAPTKGFVAPAYPAAPHCNTRGLSELGRHLVTRMVEKGMILDPDHMSASGIRGALDLIEHELIPAEQDAAAAEDRPAIQPAVVSSHSWANDVAYQRIYQLDGHVAPRTDDAAGFTDRWERHRDWADANAPEGHFFGLGYGADTNGFGGQPSPRDDPAEPVDYAGGWEAPVGGVRVLQHTSGLRTYDINTDGVAHYGLFADWFHELRLAADERHADRRGAEAIMADMLNGSESYLRMWERAVYGGGECVTDNSTLQHEDIHAALGGNVEGFLTAIGQPVDRDGAAYIYCVEGADGPEAVEVRFDASGRAATVAPSDRSVPELEATASLAGAAHVHVAGEVAGHAGALPATGGGLAPLALLLFGLTGLGAHALGRP
ncbi:MAG: hypothetical protein KY469_10190 [Actinobacteria bacterium]|nr:hypothetical protein [Actinomycetota bacterium]